MEWQRNLQLVLQSLSAVKLVDARPEAKELHHETASLSTTICKNTEVKAVHSLNIPAESPNGPITLMHIQFDTSRAIPVTSTTYHDSMNKKQLVARRDNFRPLDCPQLHVPTIQPDCKKTFTMTPEQRQISNYLSFHRGHMTPVNPYRFHSTAMDSTFYCVNVAPQEPWTNISPWKAVEESVHRKTNAGYVMTGLCSDDSPNGATLENVRVPSCFWKLVCYLENSETYVVGFIAENSLFNRHNTTLGLIRSNETKRPRSQSEVLFRYGGDIDLIRQAWSESSSVLLTNREAAFAPIPQSCIDKLDLPSQVEDDWQRFVYEVSLEIENELVSE